MSKPTPAQTRRKSWSRSIGRGVALAPALWLTLCVLMFLGWTASIVHLPCFMVLYLLCTCIASAAAFIVVWRDKRNAESDQPRVSERTLHLISLSGGWPGSILAGRFFRHKTQKLSFRLCLSGIVVMHVLVILFLFWSWWI